MGKNAIFLATPQFSHYKFFHKLPTKPPLISLKNSLPVWCCCCWMDCLCWTNCRTCWMGIPAANAPCSNESILRAEPPEFAAAAAANKAWSMAGRPNCNLKGKLGDFSRNWGFAKILHGNGGKIARWKKGWRLNLNNFYFSWDQCPSANFKSNDSSFRKNGPRNGKN